MCGLAFDHAVRRRGQSAIGIIESRIELERDGRSERSDGGEAAGQLGVAELIQPLSGRGGRDQSGQALLGVAAMPIDVLAGERLDQVALRGRQGTLSDEELGQRPPRFEDLGPERGGNDRRGDQVVVEGDQAEKHVGGGIAESIHGLSRSGPAARPWPGDSPAARAPFKARRVA